MTKETLSYSDEKLIADSLLGRTVRKVTEDTLLLDNGDLWQIIPNEGGCSCGAGDYTLEELNECPDNAIMGVDFEENQPSDWGDPYRPQAYRVFVLAADRRIKLWDVTGDDGSGYYGSGYYIRITKKEEAE